MDFLSVPVGESLGNAGSKSSTNPEPKEESGPNPRIELHASNHLVSFESFEMSSMDSKPVQPKKRSFSLRDDLRCKICLRTSFDSTFRSSALIDGMVSPEPYSFTSNMSRFLMRRVMSPTVVGMKGPVNGVLSLTTSSFPSVDLIIILDVYLR